MAPMSMVQEVESFRAQRRCRGLKVVKSSS